MGGLQDRKLAGRGLAVRCTRMHQRALVGKFGGQQVDPRIFVQIGVIGARCDDLEQFGQYDFMNR